MEGILKEIKCIFYFICPYSTLYTWRQCLKKGSNSAACYDLNDCNLCVKYHKKGY